MTSPSPWVGREYLPALQGARGQGEGPLQVQVTRPPFPCAGQGALRVIGERQGEAGREWILAYERYCRVRPK